MIEPSGPVQRTSCAALIRLFLVLPAFLHLSPAAAQQSIPFDSPRWKQLDAQVSEHLGRLSLQGVAILPDVRFGNGVIEFDVAVDGRRSYPGVVFHMQDLENFEHIYIRPHRAGLYPDAVQYAPTRHGIASWQLYNGEGYTAATTMPTNSWVPVRIEVRGRQARVFVGETDSATLVVSHLQLGATSGMLGLSGPKDGSAYFSNFRFREETDLSFDPPAAAVLPAGAIMDWWISRALPADRVDRSQYPHFYAVFGAGWHHVVADSSGLVDIGRTTSRANPRGDLVLARAFLFAPRARDVTLTLGYSDDVELYLNGRRLFSGRSGYQSRDPSFLGIVGPFDDLHVHLEKGLNEVLLMVTERFGGWGFRVSSDPPLAPKRTAHQLTTLVWETPTELLTPESAIYDSVRQVVYVSNFDNQYEKTTEPTGYISRLSMDGTILDKQWVSRLRAPTGMAIWRDTLFVAERKDLAAVEIATGRVVARWPIPDVEFPNDVAVAPDGTIYISDTRTTNWADSRIYRFRNGVFDVFANEGISRANGLCVHDGKLLVGSSGDGFLKTVDLETGRVEPVVSLGAGIIDGIRVDEEGNYLVSHWEGQLYRISPDGTIVEILDALPRGRNTADFEYLAGQRTVIVPSFLGNSVMAYRLGVATDPAR